MCFSGRVTEKPWSPVERKYWKPSGRGQQSLLAPEKLFHSVQMLPTDVTSSWLTLMRKNMEVFERRRSSLHQVNKYWDELKGLITKTHTIFTVSQ